jgi:hypothetical protein
VGTNIIGWMMARSFWEDKLTEVPVCRGLVDNYDIIKKELLRHISDPNVMQDYPNYTVDNNKMIYEKYWKAAPLSAFKDEHVEINGSETLKNLVNHLIHKARENCPTFYSIIKEQERLGNLCNSFISKLIPGTRINPHSGWSDNYMRVHLGLVCDPECKITVGKETKTWEEGKFLAFNDGDMHSVYHGGTRERIVLSIDLRLVYLKQFIG